MMRHAWNGEHNAIENADVGEVLLLRNKIYFHAISIEQT